MIISISQPTLFPWIGYFDIIKNSDIFVFLDIVKFEKRSWQMRNRLKKVSKEKEEPVWIRIPTKLENSNTLIKDVLIDNSQKWKEQHITAFKSHYGNNFDKINFLNEIYQKDWQSLSDFNIEFITNSCKFLDINTRLVRSSDLRVNGKKSLLLLDICKNLGAKKYLSTVGAKDYLESDRGAFDKEKITILYHEYKHPTYQQRGKTFIENLSILDLLFNELDNSKKFIEKS